MKKKIMRALREGRKSSSRDEGIVLCKEKRERVRERREKEREREMPVLQREKRTHASQSTRPERTTTSFVDCVSVCSIIVELSLSSLSLSQPLFPTSYTLFSISRTWTYRVKFGDALFVILLL